MVFVGMGGDDSFELCDALFFQITDHQGTVGHITAVDEDILAAAG